jgi:hypothetical protein
VPQICSLISGCCAVPIFFNAPSIVLPVSPLPHECEKSIVTIHEASNVNLNVELIFYG